jgi:hypothetical protein
MNTYFTHRRVTGSGHLLNRWLEGYCRGNLPRVPRTGSYSLKIVDTIGSIQRQMAGEPNILYQETTPPLQAEEMGPPT